MANLIRGNDEIKSILSPSGRAIKLSQYADDTVLILSDLVHSIPKALETIGTYCAASCMKLNVDKTEGMLLGSTKLYNTQFRKSTKQYYQSES